MGNMKFKLVILLDKDLRERIERFCTREERTFSWLTRKALEDFLSRHECRDTADPI